MDTLDSLNQRLARLRKLWCFAKSQKKEAWATQIVKDAKKLKAQLKENSAPEVDNVEFMEKLVNESVAIPTPR